MDETGVLGLIEELSILLEDSKPVFGKNNLRQVDITAAFEIMDEIRDTFPGEFAQARQIVRERQSLLDDAEAESSRLIEDARSQAMTIGQRAGNRAYRAAAGRHHHGPMPASSSVRRALAPKTTLTRCLATSSRALIRLSQAFAVPPDRLNNQESAANGATVENNPLVIDVPAELFAPAESSSFEGTYDHGRV